MSNKKMFIQRELLLPLIIVLNLLFDVKHCIISTTNHFDIHRLSMANDRVQVYDNSNRDYISIEHLWLFSNKDNTILKKTITGCF